MLKYTLGFVCILLPLCPAPHIITWDTSIGVKHNNGEFLPWHRGYSVDESLDSGTLLAPGRSATPKAASQLYAVPVSKRTSNQEDRTQTARTASVSVQGISKSTRSGFMIKPSLPALGIDPSSKKAASNTDANGRLPNVGLFDIQTKPKSVDTKILRIKENKEVGTVDVDIQTIADNDVEIGASTASLLGSGAVSEVILKDDERNTLELKSSSSVSPDLLQRLLERVDATRGKLRLNLNALQALQGVQSAIGLYLCRPRIRIVIKTVGGGLLAVPFRPHIVISWASCCNKPSSNFYHWGQRWYHDQATKSCRKTNNVFVGIFASKAICESRCCTAASPCNKDCREPRAFIDGASGTSGSTVGSWDYANGKTIASHGQSFWCGGRSCTCNNGEITCPAGTCAKRKNIRYTWSSERDSLVDAMHWVKDGCPDSTDPDSSLPLAVSKCINPDTGSSGWELASFFENHLTYSGNAHGIAAFFPWHRKYLKEYESVLQQFNKCVMIPYWDWTQDSGNEDSIPWLSHCDPSIAANGGTGCPSQAPSTHNDIWGKLGKASNGGTDYPFGDGYAGMPSGRFRCDATQPLNTQWNLNSYALGSSAAQDGNSGPYPCLFRNSRTSLSIPSIGTVNSYLAATSYQQLMGFEGNPHGIPHVMVGGSAQGSWEPRGQMGDSRSPLDPIFWIHHAGVDKVWYDWQNSDPSHFFDYSYFGSESLTDKLGGIGQWDYNPASGMAWEVQDVFDSAGTLEVCYQEGIVFYPIPYPYLRLLDISVLLPSAVRTNGTESSDSDDERRRSIGVGGDCYASASKKYAFRKGVRDSNPYNCTWPHSVSDPYACNFEAVRASVTWCLPLPPQYYCHLKINVAMTLKSNKEVYQNYFIDTKVSNRHTTPLYKYALGASERCGTELVNADQQGEVAFTENGKSKRFSLGVVYNSAQEYDTQQSASAKNLVLSGALSVLPTAENVPLNQYMQKCGQAKAFFQDKACCARGDDGSIDYGKQSCCSSQYEPVCCKGTGVTYQNECIARLSSGDTCTTLAPGKCKTTETPCACHKIYRPVCVNASRTTYENECVAKCKAPGQSYTYGSCKPSNYDPITPPPTPPKPAPDCICPAIYAPVCDITNNRFKTYSNLCLAKCDGVTKYTKGECGYGSFDDGGANAGELKSSHSIADFQAELDKFYRQDETLSPQSKYYAFKNANITRLELADYARALQRDDYKQLSYWIKYKPSSVVSVTAQSADVDCGNTASCGKVVARAQFQMPQWGNPAHLAAFIESRSRGRYGSSEGHSSSKKEHDGDNRRGIVDNLTPTDEREIVSSAQTSKTPWAQVGCISYSTTNVRCSCSGTWVSDRHLLTAGHCLSDNQAWLNVRRVYASPFNGDEIDSEDVASFAWRRMTTVRGWFDDENREYDYGLIEVYPGKKPKETETYLPGTRYGWRSFGYDNNIAQNYWWNLAGYPADVRPTWQTNWRSTPWMRRDFNGTFAGADGVQDRLIYHMMDTRGGQSGSGVYLYRAAEGSRVIYSVHRGWSGLPGDRATATTYNVATRLNSLRFAQICNWIKKSGTNVC